MDDSVYVFFRKWPLLNPRWWKARIPEAVGRM